VDAGATSPHQFAQSFVFLDVADVARAYDVLHFVGEEHSLEWFGDGDGAGGHVVVS